MNLLASALPLVTGLDPDRKRKFENGPLIIRENTLVIGNSIYPIENISTVTMAERKPVPVLVWILVGLGVISAMKGGLLATLAPLLLMGAAAVFVSYMLTRPGSRYALAVQMNGGSTASVLSDDEGFLKAIALELYEVIELEVPSNTTFNIDQSVKVDNLTGSTLRVTGIQGDIVNYVPAA